MTNKFSRFVGAAALGMAMSHGAMAGSFDGAYAGAQLGLFTNLTAELTVDGQPGSSTVGFDSMGLDRIELFGGYGMEVMPGLYLGGQLSYVAVNTFDEKFISAPGESTALEAGPGFSLKAIVGYVPSPSTMLYTTLGYQQREFEFVAKGPSGTEKADETAAGFAIGFGARQYLTERVMLTAEVLRTSYSKETFGPSALGVNLELTELTFDLGVAYRF
ncbi:MAG: porin family protein [Marinobacter sp.]|nr:porin family protein [Marinobacter sp.]